MTSCAVSVSAGVADDSLLQLARNVHGEVTQTVVIDGRIVGYLDARGSQQAAAAAAGDGRRRSTDDAAVQVRCQSDYDGRFVQTN